MRPFSISKPSKYRNCKTRIGGRTFDSKLEAKRWLVLKDKEKRGEISDLQCQPHFPLYAAYGMSSYPVCVYKPDFQYIENDRLVCCDTKGVSTALFNLKAKIFRINYPYIELRIIGDPMGAPIRRRKARRRVGPATVPPIPNSERKELNG